MWGVVDCDVTGGTRVGAIVGWAYGDATSNVTISECFSTGSVKGKRYVAGIAGEAETNVFTVKNCYSSADITGTRVDIGLAGEGDSGFGGIVGYVYAPSARTTNIINCYSTGAVAGPNLVGGIIGCIEVRHVAAGPAISINIQNAVALNKSITAELPIFVENTTGIVNSNTDLKSESLQNRVVGVSGKIPLRVLPAATLTFMPIYMHWTPCRSSTTRSQTSLSSRRRLIHRTERA